MKIIIKEYDFTYKVDLDEGVSCDQFIDSFFELANKVYHPDVVGKHIKYIYDKS
jgi:hypothetical protein